MPNDRNRERDRWRGENRGMFGYEGEGYLRGGEFERGSDRGDFGADQYRRDVENRPFESGYRGGGYLGGDWSRERGYRPNDYGDFNRGDYVRGGYLQGTASERPSFRGRGPKNYQRSDERIREDVCERLTFDDQVDATEIEVSVSTGNVTLSGRVDDRWAKRRAEDIAESIPGVRDVQNQIRVARESP